MRNFYRTISVLVILISILLSAGCNAGQPAVVVPTPDNQAIAATADALRTQVAATLVSGITATALANPPTATPMPSETTAPTSTEAPTATQVASITPPPTVVIPTLTATRRVIPPTATATQGAYQCAVTKQSITYGMKVTAGVDFDARWTVKNIGSKDWASGAADYTYIKGAKLHEGNDAYDLNTEVKTGKTVEIIVDMIAPKEGGYYQAIWALTQDGAVMCYMQIDINVQ